MCVELIITIKDDEKKKLTIPFLVYETFSFSESDPIIKKYIEEALKEFKGIPDDIVVKSKLHVK